MDLHTKYGLHLGNVTKLIFKSYSLLILDQLCLIATRIYVLDASCIVNQM